MPEQTEKDRSEAKVRVLKDEIVRPATARSAKEYSSGDGTLRCVTAEVEYDGKFLEMSFLTDKLEWSARTIAELYRARWGIETFFKELKQTCQIRDFVGYSENAVSPDSWASSGPACGSGATSCSCSNPTGGMGQHVAESAS